MVCCFSNSVKDEVDNFFSQNIMSSSVAVSSIFLSVYQILRVEKILISSSSDFVNTGGLQINLQRSGDELASACLLEESLEGVVLVHVFVVSRKGSIRGDAVF